MKPNLYGKIAVVTGAAGGLGRGMALMLAKAGADVAVHYHSDVEAAQETVQELKSFGIKATAVQADFRALETIPRCFAQIETELGSPDILINNASLFFQKTLEQTSVAEFHQMLTINLTAVHACCQCVLPGMKKKGWGRIVNIGLATAEQVRAYRRITAHAISKTGVQILTKSLAVENAEFGITVNAISPGLMDNGRADADTLEWQKNRVPMHKNGTVEDIFGALYYFLNSADYVTGTNIIVSGGWGI